MFKQALKMTWRDWRCGELRLLMLAVFLAVTALCAVGFFADRLNASLTRDAQQLIGGDVVIASDQPLPEEFLEQAQTYELQTTHMATFPTMARTPEGVGTRGASTRLVALKAVQATYPLRGVLYVKANIDAPLTSSQIAPNSGEVWVAPELLVSLGIEVGDSLLLGNARFKVTQLIIIEPDGNTEGFITLGPRVLMNFADLAQTGLVQPASRINYRFAVADNDGNRVQAFDDWAKQRIQSDAQAQMPMRGIRIERLATGQPTMQKTLERAQKFLNLVALLSALLSAVAVVIAARDFARRHLDDCAMLRVLGLSQKRIAFTYIFEFFVAGGIASIAGVLTGYVLHYVFIALLAQLLGHNLPAASWIPAFYGVGVGCTLLVAFGLPPVLQLSQVPPLRVLRRDLGALPAKSILVFLAGALGFILLLLVMSANLTLGLIIVGGFAGAVLVFAVLAYVIIWALKPLAHIPSIPSWLRLTIRSISARPLVMVTQVSALAIGLLALMLLFLLRTDLIQSWQKSTPPDAPNRFVINMMPDQAHDFQTALKSAGVNQYDWYPMILGRIMQINGQPINFNDYPDEKIRRLVDREFSLSYTLTPPSYNEVVQGQWVANEKGAISVESGLMDKLGLKLGDTLTFSIAGQTLESRITSVRKLDWSSMHVNFFVIYPRKDMPDFAQTYISAFKAPDDRYFDDSLSRAFPNITNINVSAMLLQIQMILNQVIRAVEFLFIFTLMAGLIVLYAAISTTREQRARDFAIMRALGASNSLLQNIQNAELMGMGAIAGFTASLVALGISGALVVFVFDFAWSPPLWIVLLGMIVGMVLAWLAGWLSLRSVLKRPVSQTLKAVFD